ncbi:RNA methyltransferase [Alicyclobacillus contaminans]|uniref:THUMP domain-containing class I SAM-dependent RNA methyltransferase n=1 Tax=Alicyclobacillus contaminans TaxID=392016 RepID=UPI0003FBABED|nr:class I SAM-dependent RNA methyltransferase [Alicyclobacillus contaminans]GMA49683.1 RNA methyltransferase [Alicyclobacillus contaminans]
MTAFTFVATTPMGLEAVLKRELLGLGFEDARAFNGYVEFTGDETTVARCNLWLRTADRLLLKMGEFEATTFDELFEGTKALPWPDLLPITAHFPVEGRSVKSQLASVPACQRIVKKAIVDRLSQAYRVHTFPESGATYAVEVALHNNRALLTVDTSGAGLHKRGYRTGLAAAPIKETLAAALVLLSWWKPHRPFADPLCGSGTIAIEAAMLGRNIAPGLQRSFAAEGWGLLPDSAWADERKAAYAAIRQDVELDITASDVDPNVLRLAARHCEAAGVDLDVRIVQQDVRDFHPSTAYGCVVTNPPYGERLGDQREVEALYRSLGRVMARLDTWSTFVITSHPRFESLFGRRADKRRKLYNGRIETQFYQYLGPLPPRKEP